MFVFTFSSLEKIILKPVANDNNLLIRVVIKRSVPAPKCKIRRHPSAILGSVRSSCLPRCKTFRVVLALWEIWMYNTSFFLTFFYVVEKTHSTSCITSASMTNSSSTNTGNGSGHSSGLTYQEVIDKQKKMLNRRVLRIQVLYTKVVCAVLKHTWRNCP